MSLSRKEKQRLKRKEKKEARRNGCVEEYKHNYNFTKDIITLFSREKNIRPYDILRIIGKDEEIPEFLLQYIEEDLWRFKENKQMTCKNVLFLIKERRAHYVLVENLRKVLTDFGAEEYSNTSIPGRWKIYEGIKDALYEAIFCDIKEYYLSEIENEE
jgi:hypothetical protein